MTDDDIWDAVEPYMDKILGKPTAANKDRAREIVRMWTSDTKSQAVADFVAILAAALDAKDKEVSVATALNRIAAALDRRAGAIWELSKATWRQR